MHYSEISAFSCAHRDHSGPTYAVWLKQSNSSLLHRVFFFLSHLQKRKFWASQDHQMFSLMPEGILTPFCCWKMQILLIRLYNSSRLIMSAYAHFMRQLNQSRDTSSWPICIISRISICDAYLSGIRNIQACMSTAACKSSCMKKCCSQGAAAHRACLSEHWKWVSLKQNGTKSRREGGQQPSYPVGM